MKANSNSVIDIFTIACLLILCFTACKKHELKSLDEKLIAKIARENIEYPSTFSSIPFFGGCSGKQIALVHIQDLRAIHTLKYKDLSFLEFLKKSLNRQITIEYQDKVECFDLSKDVTAFYENNSFNTFLNSYTEKTGNNRLILRATIEKNQIKTILYYLFRNNYLASYDDNIGKYYINETSSFYSNVSN